MSQFQFDPIVNIGADVLNYAVISAFISRCSISILSLTTDSLRYPQSAQSAVSLLVEELLKISVDKDNCLTQKGALCSVVTFLGVLAAGSALSMIYDSGSNRQLLIVFYSSLFYFVRLNYYAFQSYGLYAFKVFLPVGTPSNRGIIFLIVSIEIISYVIRLFSLAIRLFANSLAGHILLHLFSRVIFVDLMHGLSNIKLFVFRWVTVWIHILIIGLETIISIVQRFVWCNISNLYQYTFIE